MIREDKWININSVVNRAVVVTERDTRNKNDREEDERKDTISMKKNHVRIKIFASNISKMSNKCKFNKVGGCVV